MKRVCACFVSVKPKKFYFLVLTIDRTYDQIIQGINPGDQNLAEMKDFRKTSCRSLMFGGRVKRMSKWRSQGRCCAYHVAVVFSTQDRYSELNLPERRKTEIRSSNDMSANNLIVMNVDNKSASSP